MMFVLVAIIAFAAAATPARPKISPIFSIHGKVMLKDGNGPHHLQGQGRYHVNPSLAIVSSSGNKGCGVEDFNFPGGHRLFFLERNDMGKDFEYAGEGHNQTCHSRNTTGSMQDPWRWIITATYDGRRGHGKHTVDIWNNTFSDPKRGVLRLAVAVLSHDPSRPVFFGRIWTDEKGTKHDMFLEIEQFDSTKPDPKEFHVPYECSNNNNHVAPLLTRPFMKLVQARKPLLRKLVSARK